MAQVRVIRQAEITGAFFSRAAAEAPDAAVREIVEAVKNEGDAALRKLSERFDKFAPPHIIMEENVLEECRARLERENPALYASICLSRDLALKFARMQKECFADFEEELSPGLFAGQKNIPVERAGLYAPAGRFPLLSSVVMCACPAVAAGVGDIVLCTPPIYMEENARRGIFADANILAAAALCGVKRAFAVGGAQAIAALAYGTESVPKADVIAGPGNRFVTAAKRAVFGDVGVDIPAGPSEVLIIADGSGRPEWVAADMLAQSEHDTAAQAILLTPDAAFAQAVADAIDRLMDGMISPESAARVSIPENGYIVVVDGMEAAAALANKKAPEHLELAMEPGPARDALAASLRNYGSLFIGHRSAEVLGDYAAGINHTLPTAGAAAFAGGLSVRHFIKTVTSLRCAESAGADLSGWRASLEAARAMARAEGLEAHEAAARLRGESFDAPSA